MSNWPSDGSYQIGGGGGGGGSYSSNSSRSGSGRTYIYTTTGFVFCPLSDEQMIKKATIAFETSPLEVSEEPKVTGGVDGWVLARFRCIDF